MIITDHGTLLDVEAGGTTFTLNADREVGFSADYVISANKRPTYFSAW